MSKLNVIIISGKQYIFSVGKDYISVMLEENGGTILVNFDKQSLDVQRAQYIPPRDTLQTFESVQYGGNLTDFREVAGQVVVEVE